MPEGAVYVGRPTVYGNPYLQREDESRDELVEMYRHYVLTMVHPWIRRAWFRELRGKDLVCWCPLDQPCHADVLLELANR